MSGYIIIDTEGTGLFVTKNPDGSTRRSDEPGQPRMAQYAHVLLNDQFEIEHVYSAYIQPRGWLNEDGSPITVMPPKAYEIHGLSMDFLMENGIPASLPLALYSKAVLEGRTMVAHNSQHDGRQVRAELRHHGQPDLFHQTLTTCTMRSASAGKMKIKKLNGKGGNPRLVDLCAHLGIKHDPDRRHAADEDAMACALCAAVLGKAGLLLPGEVHRAADLQQQEG